MISREVDICLKIFCLSLLSSKILKITEIQKRPVLIEENGKVYAFDDSNNVKFFGNDKLELPYPEGNFYSDSSAKKRPKY